MSIFSGTPAPMVKRAKFDLSHDVKLSGDMAYLIPVLCQDVLPGESWRNKSTVMLRFAPLLAPIMHLIYVTMHFFFVPNRILCSDWEDFITSGELGDSIAEAPYFVMDTIAKEANSSEANFKYYLGEGSLWDYLGLPAQAYSAVDGNYVSTQRINALPFMAYYKVFEDYYRDEWLYPYQVMEEPLSGGDQSALFSDLGAIQVRAWQKDQFTSALLSPQRGAEVLMPLDADVTYKSISDIVKAGGSSWGVNDLGPIIVDDAGSPEAAMVVDGAVTGPQDVRVENIASISNGSITINDLRTAIVLQRWLEANARGGNRYKESILSHFNTVVPDYRLNRPEYLGGGRQLVQISEVLATAFSEDGSANTIPQGNMAGHGISIGSSNQFTYSCKEHGWILGILSVQPVSAYQQGLPKKFTKLDRYEYGWPEFVGLGEQEMASKELYFDAQDTDANNDVLFGYQQRYYEYKFEPSRVCGDFRSTLDYWHMGRKFSARPSLDTAFVYEDPTKRIFAVQTEGVHSLWMQVHHQLSALRPFPYYSVPGLMRI